MSNYTKTTNFAAKDSLPSGNAAKIVKGAEIDTEFNNIATASATKANANNAALTGTTVFATLSDGTIGVTGWVDEDNMSSDSAVLIPTQQSVKAYVDSNVTAQDLDVTDGSASIDIDLDSESLGILGGTGVTSTASGTGVTLAIDSTVTTLTGTQTLTNKTLTTPTILTSFTIGSATITEAELEILDGATVTTAELNVLDGITSTTAELNILDGVTSTAAELNILDGVTSTTAELNKLDGFTGTVADLNYAKDLNATGVTASEFDILDGLTATTAELNILDGVTSTTAELNILDGVTSTASELNILDGVTSTATELNILDGVTATTAEINYVDGVTSNVQTQINTKAPIAGATFTGTTTIPTADINGGAIDGTVIGGSTAAAGSFTTLGASGAITGTLGTAAQGNITSVGTLSALTVSGNLTVDTNSLKVDSSTNRVGILNASPDVTLDIGTATDAVHMPTGTTAQRPTGAAGYFRYNSSLEQFEGYTDAWGAIGGGGGSNLVSDTMTGDGSDTTLTLSNDPLNENNTQVYIDGVYQNKDTYSVSGTTLTFSTAPPNGSAVEAMTIQPTAVNVPADASVTSAKLSGALTTPSTLAVTGGITATTADNLDTLSLISTDADATVGPNLRMYRNSGSPADSDVIGAIDFDGRNDNSQDVQYAQIIGQVLDASDGTEDGTLYLQTIIAGTTRERLSLQPTESVFNEASVDLDFRVESDNSTHALFVQGSDGNVGIGTGSPTRTFHSKGASGINTVGKFESGSSQVYIQLSSNGLADADSGYIGYNSDKNLTLLTDNVERMRIDSSGRVTTPYQPAFTAKPASIQSNIAIGSDVTIVFGTEIFDQGGNFASNTFTAPVTGKYQLQFMIRLEAVDTAASFYQIKLTTTNRQYIFTLDPRVFSQDVGYHSVGLSVLADMDEDDTALVAFRQSGGTQQADIATESFFSGYLVA